MYVFLAVPGLCCCRSLSLVAASKGRWLVVVHELLTAAVSLWSTDSRVLGFQKLQHVGSVVVVPRL